MTALPHTARARCVSLEATPTVPDWIELLPAGPQITGADGRAWTLPAPQTVVDAFGRRAAAMVVDWEHASETRARQGLDAPAAGWIDQLEVRQGAIWGRVTWTEKAAAQIAAREYRYLSPVFTFEKTSARIAELVSVGLTNQPNLHLTALNREDSPMPLSDALCQALELPVEADEATAINRVKALREGLRAANARAEQPSLDRFVPRADYDAVLARASNAEQRLTAFETERHAATIKTLLDRGLAEGKIVPATLDYYQAMCQTEGGIAAFEAFLAKAPALLGGLSAPAGAPPDTTPKALNRAAFDALSPSARKAHLAQGGQITD